MKQTDETRTFLKKFFAKKSQARTKKLVNVMIQQALKQPAGREGCENHVSSKESTPNTLFKYDKRG